MSGCADAAASREEFESRLREFVRGVAGESVRIRKNTPLFSTGLIDSMMVLDFVLLIEDAIGRTLSDNEITLESFRTIDAICSTFWKGSAAFQQEAPHRGKRR